MLVQTIIIIAVLPLTSASSSCEAALPSAALYSTLRAAMEANSAIAVKRGRNLSSGGVVELDDSTQPHSLAEKKRP